LPWVQTTHGIDFLRFRSSGTNVSVHAKKEKPMESSKQPPEGKRSIFVSETSAKASRSVDHFCAEAGIGRVTCYKEIKKGRIIAKKCGARTLITTTPNEWLNSLPSFGQV
jgi:hypothetical protein